ncbi:uncharacterized protein E0L32_005863 [Thyridium curvatum]|uniref:Transcription factor BYE1 n=1 Tax=Thyridium curvatum TaxID=1093900 RepID=A0A507BAP3_9PEZI|nr:uncharacterized protein E0L32_005863 [Thyridium curvatum]TPX13660.1 hypothetical protein E0L32_005863 [Thyridium curvatum]
MSDPEPRRSVRSTKGQHKALDQLEQSLEPKRRGKKGKKSEEKQEEPEEEVIRCVCGATEQDEDSGEPWIACDTCGAWQHNVCMGMSQYTEDLPKEYFCEICKPEDHKELLEGMAKGEKPWEARRKAYEEEEARGKKKKGGRKAKGKRHSDQKEDTPQATQKPKKTPPPEIKKETKSAAGAKRKSRGPSEDVDVKQGSQKLRKVSENAAVPVPVAYDPPSDLPDRIAELPDTRQGPAKLILKSMVHAVGIAEKKSSLVPDDGVSVEARAERFTLQIERAVSDSHPNHKEYAAQIRSLAFNLKQNQDLCNRLLSKTLTPPMLAVMTSDDLASKELQRETAEMRARAEKQSILITEDGPPRVRRTHKGEELVETDDTVATTEERPALSRRQTAAAKAREKEASSAAAEAPGAPSQAKASPKEGLHIDTQGSPKHEFDINKVFSSVRSPSTTQPRRPSQPVPPSAGPGDDPDVDRLLEDDREESPPYSPTEESDPDVIWRGNLVMNSVANFQATAKHVGGVNLNKSIGLPWTTLIPKRLLVAGRIDEQKATEYLCSLRYSTPTDVVVVAVSPSNEAAKADFYNLIDYFVSKKRYGVVGDKGVGNVRDTYLVPVLPGHGNHPEFMMNLEDNFLPQVRSEPTLLVVFVYRNDPAVMEKLHGPNWAGQPQASQSPAANTPTPVPVPAGYAQRNPSISAPAFSPASPQGAFPPPQQATPTPIQTQTPIQPAPVARPPPPPPPAAGATAATAAPPAAVRHPSQAAEAAREAAQREGEATARNILGPFFNCPTAGFLMAQAHNMQPNQWNLIRDIYEREPRAREDLQYFSSQIEKAGQHRAQAAAQQQQLQQQHAAAQAKAQQPHPPASAATQHPPAPPPQPQAQAQNKAPAPQSHPPPAPPKISQTPVPIPQIPPMARHPPQHSGAAPKS